MRAGRPAAPPRHRRPTPPPRPWKRPDLHHRRLLPPFLTTLPLLLLLLLLLPLPGPAPAAAADAPPPHLWGQHRGDHAHTGRWAHLPLFLATTEDPVEELVGIRRGNGCKITRLDAADLQQEYLPRLNNISRYLHEGLVGSGEEFNRTKHCAGDYTYIHPAECGRDPLVSHDGSVLFVVYSHLDKCSSTCSASPGDFTYRPACSHKSGFTQVVALNATTLDTLWLSPHLPDWSLTEINDRQSPATPALSVDGEILYVTTQCATETPCDYCCPDVAQGVGTAGRGSLFALRTSDGQLTPAFSPNPVPFRSRVGAPTVDPDGTAVYVGNGEGTGSGESPYNMEGWGLHKIDAATGTRLWFFSYVANATLAKYPAEDRSYLEVSTGPAVHGDSLVFLGTNWNVDPPEGAGTRFFVVDKATGNLRWERDAGDRFGQPRWGCQDSSLPVLVHRHFAYVLCKNSTHQVILSAIDLHSGSGGGERRLLAVADDGVAGAAWTYTPSDLPPASDMSRVSWNLATNGDFIFLGAGAAFVDVLHAGNGSLVGRDGDPANATGSSSPDAGSMMTFLPGHGALQLDGNGVNTLPRFAQFCDMSVGACAGSDGGGGGGGSGSGRLKAAPPSDSPSPAAGSDEEEDYDVDGSGPGVVEWILPSTVAVSSAIVVVSPTASLGAVSMLVGIAHLNVWMALAPTSTPDVLLASGVSTAWTAGGPLIPFFPTHEQEAGSRRRRRRRRRQLAGSSGAEDGCAGQDTNAAVQFRGIARFARRAGIPLGRLLDCFVILLVPVVLLPHAVATCLERAGLGSKLPLSKCRSTAFRIFVLTMQPLTTLSAFSAMYHASGQHGEAEGEGSHNFNGTSPSAASAASSSSSCPPPIDYNASAAPPEVFRSALSALFLVSAVCVLFVQVGKRLAFWWRDRGADAWRKEQAGFYAVLFEDLSYRGRYYAVVPIVVDVGVGITIGLDHAAPGTRQVVVVACFHLAHLVWVTVQRPFEDRMFGIVKSLVGSFAVINVLLMFCHLDDPASGLGASEREAVGALQFGLIVGSVLITVVGGNLKRILPLAVRCCRRNGGGSDNVSAGGAPAVAQLEMSTVKTHENPMRSSGLSTLSAWRVERDADGNLYFWNEETGNSQWERPEGFSASGGETRKDTAADAAAAHGGGSRHSRTWSQEHTEDGHVYYVNQETGASQWERPEGVDDVVHAAK